ncbi:MAG: aldo/keto reductase [Treponema sp.]|jgi:aryl-alcohol dehydrogenase-like predicted oxidoreductase|nr:aldo/keto reductase [Treponema sp.]
MQTVTLGRTKLKASVAGLGCGGHSRIGLEKYGSDHAASIVRTAFDEGLNFFDTATAYGTQGSVGKGLAGIPRDAYILSTKFPYKNKTGGELLKTLEESLWELKTDYIDIYHLHGVAPQDYVQVRDSLVPVLQKARQAGKIRFLGITEAFGSNTTHDMFKQALPDDFFDVIMVGYNLLNPSALKTVLPLTREKGVGTLCMFAVRSALSNPAQLKIDIGRILEKGQADPALVPRENTLEFLTRDGVAASIMEAAYRFCRHTPGIDVVLTGTSNPDHLRTNIAAIQGPRLPDAILARLEAMFGKVDCVSGQ